MLAHDDTGNHYKEAEFWVCFFYFGLCLECQPVTNSILVKLHPHPHPPQKNKKKTKAKIKQTKQSKTKHLTLPPPKKSI